MISAQDVAAVLRRFLEELGPDTDMLAVLRALRRGDAAAQSLCRIIAVDLAGSPAQAGAHDDGSRAPDTAPGALDAAELPAQMFAQLLPLAGQLSDGLSAAFASPTGRMTIASACASVLGALVSAEHVRELEQQREQQRRRVQRRRRARRRMDVASPGDVVFDDVDTAFLRGPFAIN